MLSDAAFTGYVEQYMDMVFRLAYSYLKNRPDAEDTAQTVFLKLYRSDKPFAGGEHVKHWLLRVTVNECRKLLRSPAHGQPGLDSVGEPAVPADTRRTELLDAVMRLKPPYRAALYLYYYEDCSTAEMARILSIPRATVLTHLRRAREALKKEWTEADHV